MTTAPQTIQEIHPDALKVLTLGGLLANREQNEQFRKYIGRDVRFTNWKPSDGTLKRDHTFRIIGIQKIFSGELAFRVLCNGFQDTFGCVAQFDKVEFI
jgi:hypothetical protein